MFFFFKRADSGGKKKQKIEIFWKAIWFLTVMGRIGQSGTLSRKLNIKIQETFSHQNGIVSFVSFSSVRYV